MKRSELKSIVKECVKEILFEEGVLSSLVAESNRESLSTSA